MFQNTLSARPREAALKDEAWRSFERPPPRPNGAPLAALRFENVPEWDEADAPPREWLIPDRIPHRAVTLLSGEGATGKSILALDLAVAVVMRARMAKLHARDVRGRDLRLGRGRGRRGSAQAQTDPRPVRRELQQVGRTRVCAAVPQRRGRHARRPRSQRRAHADPVVRAPAVRSPPASSTPHRPRHSCRRLRRLGDRSRASAPLHGAIARLSARSRQRRSRRGAPVPGGHQERQRPVRQHRMAQLAARPPLSRPRDDDGRRTGQGAARASFPQVELRCRLASRYGCAGAAGFS